MFVTIELPPNQSIAWKMEVKMVPNRMCRTYYPQMSTLLLWSCKFHIYILLCRISNTYVHPISFFVFLARCLKTISSKNKWMEGLALQLPFTRVKRVCKLDPALNNISTDAIRLLTLAAVSFEQKMNINNNMENSRKLGGIPPVTSLDFNFSQKFSNWFRIIFYLVYHDF